MAGSCLNFQTKGPASWMGTMPGTSYKDYIMEALAPVGGVTARAMFGGFGLYKGGVMFGLIAMDELYFKVNDSNQADYAARKSKPFVYEGKTKAITISYWRVPEDVLEDAEELKLWVKKAYDVALKSRKAAATKPKPRRPPGARRRRR